MTGNRGTLDKRPGKGGPANLKGQRFGKLVAVEYIKGVPPKYKASWRCICDCGGEKITRAENLRRGKSTHCGCDSHAIRVAQVTKHGHSAASNEGRASPTYRAWHAMRQRCGSENHRAYPDYGGRGISVCDRWSDFRNFLADMGERPEGKTLDRINVNGNYEPSNCRWATQAEQAANKRPRLRHGDFLELVGAARILVAANDNELPSAIDAIRSALGRLDREHG